MSWLSKLLSAVLQDPKRDPMDGKWWGDQSIVAMTGVSVTSESVLQLDVVQACLEALAGPISTLPMVVFERLPDGERKQLRDHPLHALLNERPNRRQTAQEFWDDMARHLASWRNCYALIEPGRDGPIGSLRTIHPSLVTKIERRADVVFYTISDGGRSIEYREDLVFHIRKAPLLVNGLAGQPYWETAKETFGRAIAVEQYGALYFANGGSGGGLLKHPGSFKTKEEQREFLDAWRSAGAGNNRHKDRLLLYGVDYKREGDNNDEAQFLETLKACETKILGLWNMPPHRAQRLDKSTNNNIEHQSLEFVMHTLAPWLNGIEQACKRDLLPSEGDKDVQVEFNLLGLLRGAIEARFKAYAQARQWGWLSVNDIRRLENMNAIPEGDEYLRPMNMTPAGAEEGTQTNAA